MRQQQNVPPVERGGQGLRGVAAVIIPALIVLGFIVSAALFVRFNKKPEKKERAFNPLAVIADYAVRDNVQLEVSTQGEAMPRTEIDLVPEVGGKIVYVSPNFIDGAIFQKGETLIRIDDSDYKVAVIRAESGVAQAEQSLVQEIAEGEIARRDFEELGQGEPTALAMRKPQRARAEASLLAAKADLQSAKLQLTRTFVKAPFTGRVKTKSSDLGQFVSPGSRLGRIFSTDIFQVRLPLTDSDLAKLELPIAFNAKDRDSALPVRLSAQVAGKEQIWDGYIMRTDSSYDTQTRALYAIAEVFDPYGKGISDNGMPLAPGLFVSANIKGRTIDSVIVLPRDGLRPEDKVYVVDDKGKAEIRDAVVIDTSAERAILRSGVEPGELVVLGPMEKSRITMTLKVLNAKDPTEVLVDPPRPKRDEDSEGEGSDDENSGDGGTDTQDEGGSSGSENTETSADGNDL